MPNMTTGEKIREMRKKRNLTQKQLAERLGTVPQNIGQWERGVRVPRAGTVARIAAALECQPTEIIGVMAVQSQPIDCTSVAIVKALDLAWLKELALLELDEKKKEEVILFAKFLAQSC